MKHCRSYVILPGGEGVEVFDSPPPFVSDGVIWTVNESLSLEGCFYDYIREKSGQLAGFRYWIGSRESGLHDTAFGDFLSDKRFFFSKDNIFVDILFDAHSAGRFQEGHLVLDVLQDFGGEFALKSSQGTTGIGFSIQV